MTKSAVIRTAVEDLKQKIEKEERNKHMDEKLYIEETTRKDTGYHAFMAWDKGELVEMMGQQLTDGTDDERFAIAEILANRVDNGEVITLGKTYVSKFYVGTSETLKEARKEKAASDAEIDSIPMPSPEELKRLMDEFRKSTKEQ